VWVDPKLASDLVVLGPSGKGLCHPDRRMGVRLPVGWRIEGDVAGTCYPIGMAFRPH